MQQTNNRLELEDRGVTAVRQPQLSRAQLRRKRSSALTSLARGFGPGIILMMTGVGTSHLVTVPTAGGRFAYALLWCVPLAYIIKYYGFEMAFRFTHGTGKTLIEAYGTAWRKWPLWYLLVTTLLQCAVGQAGRLIAASAVLYFFFSSTMGWEIPMAVYGMLLGLMSVGIILTGGYRAVEFTAKTFAALLIVTLIAVYLVKPAPLSALPHFFIIETPAGSWLIIAALLGLLPTGMDVSLQASEWGKAKNVGLASLRGHLELNGLAPKFDPFASQKEELTVNTTKLPSSVRDYSARWFRIGLWDFRLGHIMSFVQAALFLLLAATWLYPSQVDGQAVMGEIGKTFTASVGPWMMVVFLVSAFAATFSTAFNYFDGWPRIVGACCRNLFRGTAELKGTAREDVPSESRSKWYSEYNIYRLTMIYSLVAAVAIMGGLPQPVLLVLIASAVALFIAPVIYFLNLYYCLTVIPKDDKVFYPSRFARWFAGASLVVFTGLTLILILVWVLRVPPLGA